jgi:pimeloyl-ACP methyl ester carboxylesterase
MYDIRNSSGERIDHHFHPAERRDALVILGHGLTGNKDRPLLVAVAEGLAARGWPCLRISFSGNGGSDGRFEDSNITKQIGDLKAVLDNVPDYVRIAYAGHSMGGAVGVLTAAADLRIGVLISLAGMTHTAEFARREFGALVPGKDCLWEDEEFPLSAALMDDLVSNGSTLEAAAKVLQPWLLIHGADDDVVSPQDSRDAHEAAICEKRLLEIPAAGHVFDEASYPLIVDAADAWLRSHFGTTQTAGD